MAPVIRAGCPTVILETSRLELRMAALSDAAFFVRLLNEPAWLQNIGDRGVRSEAAAEAYIENSLCGHYRAHGYGMYVLQLKPTLSPIGLCGLVKRDFLPLPDLGFALLAAFAGQRYAAEAARAVMLYAAEKLGVERLCAIVNHRNDRSIRLLGKLGFRHQGPYVTPHGVQVELYATAEGSGAPRSL
jgi:ribosomal-protein-alanine N-acetyltransferase